MDKLSKVRAILKDKERLARKYKEDYNVTKTSFTKENVDDYTLDGMGPIADGIIKDGEYLGMHLMDD